LFNILKDIPFISLGKQGFNLINPSLKSRPEKPYIAVKYAPPAAAG
jgi:hypothetical protein